MKWLLPTLLLALTSTATADYVSTFEDQNLPPNSFNINAGASGQFVSGGNAFNNNYDSTFNVFSGWAISNLTNPSPLPSTGVNDFNYLYNAIPGSGSNSATYAVADTFGPSTTDPNSPNSSFVNLAANADPISIDVTNTTYDYLSMKYGDGFGKKFDTGDFFLLTISGYTGQSGAGTKVGEVDFYLANFLGSNSYIVTTWNTIDLTSLKGATSLVFGLTSSDNSSLGFGINTPALFAADNLTAGLRQVPEPASWLLCVSGLGVLSMLSRRRRTTGDVLTLKDISEVTQ